MNGYVSVKEASHKWEIPEHVTNYGKSRENQKKRLIRASRNRMGLPMKLYISNICVEKPMRLICWWKNTLIC